MSQIRQAELRARFAQALSAMYGSEVPAYKTLVDACHRINDDVLSHLGAEAERLGSGARVTAERHGAIRVGTRRELAQAAQLFAGFGMCPVGFYDLRNAYPTPIPVVSTAFRPLDQEELAANPFRVFTSLLVPEDRRFFDRDLEQRLTAFLDRRTLFPADMLELAARSAADGGLSTADAESFVHEAVACFALSAEPVDRAWYQELEAVSSVAADIGGVRSTHINHLTPRVLDIDQLYLHMQDSGVEMIEKIQGPPRWEGPDVLLRQTSFRALGEPRRFREADGSVSEGKLRVRFGEVEARGIALTPSGLERYNLLCSAVRNLRSTGKDTGASDDQVAADLWRQMLPASEAELAAQDIGYFTFHALPVPRGERPTTLQDLLAQGWVSAEPIVYEDFLPLSAAGIFSSNLTSDGSVDGAQEAPVRDRGWMEDILGAPIREPDALYARQRQASLAEVTAALDLPTGSLDLH